MIGPIGSRDYNPLGAGMSVLARTTGNAKRRGTTVSIDVRTIVAVAAVGIAGIAGWAYGARSGYDFAKRDAASIMRLSGGATYTKPAWRGWMDSPFAYEPPSDLGLLMDVVGGTIPGTGGMTSGDVWNGYQTRMQREFFGLVPANPKARTDDIARPACPPDENGNRDHGNCY